MKIAKDKKMHFGAGLLIGGLTAVVTYINNYSDLWILLVASLIGAAKELVWDMWLKKGTPEWLDFAATVLGGLVIYLIFLFL